MNLFSVILITTSSVIVGLLMAFIPVVNHPVLALPIQSSLTITLVFQWQYAESIVALQLFPSATTILKIIAYMLLAYFATREASIHLSRWIDNKLVISGSIRTKKHRCLEQTTARRFTSEHRLARVKAHKSRSQTACAVWHIPVTAWSEASDRRRPASLHF